MRMLSSPQGSVPDPGTTDLTTIASSPAENSELAVQKLPDWNPHFRRFTRFKRKEQRAYVAKQHRSVFGPPASSAPVLPWTSARLFVMWDLDNKYPEVLNYERFVGQIKDKLATYGEVEEMRAFCNYRTLNYVHEMWAAAVEMGMQHPLQVDPPAELRCPLCDRRMKDKAKLKKHFQLHEREHKKKMNHEGGKGYKKTRKYERYQSAVRQVRHKVRGFDLERILAKVGVQVKPVKMGPQTADIALVQAAKELSRRVQPPGPDSPDPRTPVLVLISDDHGFEELLKLFRTSGWGTLVIANSDFKNAQIRVPWGRVGSLGRDGARGRRASWPVGNASPRTWGRNRIRIRIRMPDTMG